MRYSILVLLLLFAHKSALAQDDSQIVYSEEPDTLVKQRFIDRYENVFMTKVPTRHMLKLSFAIIPVNTSSFAPSLSPDLNYEIGYEYKILPSFSLGLNFSTDNPIVFQRNSHNISGFIYGRWYYDMKRRIAAGKSANNFTGNYLSPVFEKRWGLGEAQFPQEKIGHFPLTKIGLEFGMQRRFLSYGRLDFGIGIFYQKYSNGYLVDNTFIVNKNITDFAIATRTNFGLAFGDWKRNSHIPLCEILKCDEFLGSKWKILWPALNLSVHNAKSTVGLAYEKKIARSPISVNAQFYGDADYRQINYIENSAVHSDFTYQLQSSLQVRYYFLQRLGIRKGFGGNNLSGCYAGPYSEYISLKSTSIDNLQNKRMGIGFIFGYQKILFRSVYIDVNTARSWNLLKTKPNNEVSLGSLRVGFGLAL